LECLNHFALGGQFHKPDTPGQDGWAELHQYGTRYIDVIGTLANDNTPEVLTCVCKGFASVVENGWSCLTDQHYEIILKFMLKAAQNPDYNVRLEALAVWGHCVDSHCTWHIVQPLLTELVPTLLQNMVYSNADYMCMEQAQLDDDNAASPDAPDEIKPRFHKDKKDVDEDDDDGENSKGGGAWGAEWTVRKAAASSLDRLSTVFQQEVVQLVLPLIEQNLQHSSWEHQECGVLAIGAIAAGCLQQLSQFLDKVIVLLLGLTSAQKPLLRTISCWCLSRFSAWICMDNNPNREEILGSVVKALLQRCLDRNKRVQEAACSALATLTESALMHLEPFLNDIVQALVRCFTLYQTKNFRILYDAIGTLAWACSWGLDKPQYIEALMAPVLHKFETVPDNDFTAIPMFECVSHLMQNLGTSLASVVPRILQRCTRIILEVGRLAQMWQQNPNEFEQPDHEIMAASIDLLAGIIEGFQGNAGQVLQQQNFLMMLPDVLRCRSPRVKQSGFALMGSAATHCIEHLMQHLPQLLPLCATGLAPGMTTMVSHNSSWAIGEVCIRVGPDIMGPALDSLRPALVGILFRQDGIDVKPWQRAGHRALLGNVCITIGRLGLVCGDLMGKEAHTFLMPWCLVMRNQRLDREKVKAFEGLLQMLRANPLAGAQCFPALAGAIASVPPMPPLVPFTEVLLAYKNHFGGNWPQVFGQLAPDVRQRLQDNYKLTP